MTWPTTALEHVIAEGFRVGKQDFNRSLASDYTLADDAVWCEHLISGGACIEVASADGVMVRDTTDRDGGTLAFSAQAWEAFTGGLKTV